VDLRVSAGWIASRLATKKEADELAPLVAALKPANHKEAELLATLLMLALRTGTMSFEEVLRLAPNRRREILDAVGLLHHKLGDALTVERARHAVKRVLAEERLGVRDSSALKSLFPKAVDHVLGQESLSTGDAEIISQILIQESTFAAEDHGLTDRMTDRVAKDQTARRVLYRKAVDHAASTDAKWPWRWSLILRGDDINWLFQVAEEMKPAPEDLWEDILTLTEPERNPTVSSSDRDRIRAAADVARPGVVQQHDERKRRALERNAEWERKRAERAAKALPVTPIAEAVASVLAGSHSIADRMRTLAAVCVSPEWAAPNDVSGTWTDLSADMQRQVLTTFRESLEKTTPTAIEEPSSINAWSAYEAAAFKALLEHKDDRTWATADLVERWLPVALHVFIDEIADLLRLCSQLQPEATNRVLIAAVRGDLENFDRFLRTAHRIPSELWSPSLADAAAQMIIDKVGLPGGREDLLYLLVDARPDVALRVARDLTSSSGDMKDRIWLAALDCRLMLEPSDAWPIARPAIEAQGVEFLKKLRSVHDRGARAASSISSWESTTLLELGRLLFALLPPDRFAPRSGRQGRTDALVGVRDRIPTILWKRQEHEALRALADHVPTVRDWYSHMLAHADASRLAQEVSKPTHDSPPQITDIVRVLEEADYRVLRTAADLRATIVDALRHVGKTIGSDVQLLYEGSKNEGRAPRHESVLQTYLVVRLRDLLSQRFLARETEVKYGRMTDVLVVAPTITGDTALVTIEVKWSDNQEICTALEEQLGKKYLIEEQQSDGIYAVAWTGSGKIPGYTKLAAASPTTAAELQKLLSVQADGFMAANRGVQVAAHVLDAEWRE
jgi:hypothetical protein